MIIKRQPENRSLSTIRLLSTLNMIDGCTNFLLSSFGSFRSLSLSPSFWFSDPYSCVGILRVFKIVFSLVCLHFDAFMAVVVVCVHHLNRSSCLFKDDKLRNQRDLISTDIRSRSVYSAYTCITSFTCISFLFVCVMCVCVMCDVCVCMYMISFEYRSVQCFHNGFLSTAFSSARYQSDRFLRTFFLIRLVPFSVCFFISHFLARFHSLLNFSGSVGPTRVYATQNRIKWTNCMVKPATCFLFELYFIELPNTPMSNTHLVIPIPRRKEQHEMKEITYPTFSNHSDQW